MCFSFRELGVLAQMNQRQLRKLEILTKKILKCEKCSRLRKNGIAIPYWTKRSKYIILAEAPGKEEVIESTPLIGESGKLLFKELKKLSLRREDFIILNTTQCRPVENNCNGKPTIAEMKNCKFWVEKYLEVSKIKYLIAFGNYAMQYLFEENSGIMSKCGTIRDYNGIKVFPSIHPANVLYNSENITFLRKSLKAFKKEIKNVR